MKPLPVNPHKRNTSHPRGGGGGARATRANRVEPGPEPSPPRPAGFPEKVRSHPARRPLGALCARRLDPRAEGPTQLPKCQPALPQAFPAGVLGAPSSLGEERGGPAPVGGGPAQGPLPASLGASRACPAASSPPPSEAWAPAPGSSPLLLPPQQSGNLG